MFADCTIIIIFFIKIVTLLPHGPTIDFYTIITIIIIIMSDEDNIQV